MSVITISRKLGSMGTYIGKKVADELGYSYVDKIHLSKIMKDYGFSKFDYIYESVPTYWEKYDEYRENTINFLAEVIMAVAQHGNVVIAGRGSFGLLDTYSDVINIRIKAKEKCRLERLMNDRNITEAEAQVLIKNNDQVRRTFVESDFRFNYTDSREFDLIFDTSIVKPDTCVNFLVENLKDIEFIRDDNRAKVSDITIEPVLVKHVNEKLIYFADHKEVLIKRPEQ